MLSTIRKFNTRPKNLLSCKIIKFSNKINYNKLKFSTLHMQKLNQKQKQTYDPTKFKFYMGTENYKLFSTFNKKQNNKSTSKQDNFNEYDDVDKKIYENYKMFLSNINNRDVIGVSACVIKFILGIGIFFVLFTLFVIFSMTIFNSSMYVIRHSPIWKYIEKLTR